MPFTDEDVIRVLEDSLRIVMKPKPDFGVRKIEALIIRMEAAEALIVHANCQCENGSSCHCGYTERKEAWLKAAAK